jgi:hypothetical protein
VNKNYNFKYIGVVKMGVTYVPVRTYIKGSHYTLKVGFPDEYNIYEKALFRGENNGELIFWDNASPDGLLVLYHCHILSASINV